jgi:hypothetical protein
VSRCFLEDTEEALHTMNGNHDDLDDVAVFQVKRQVVLNVGEKVLIDRDGKLTVVVRLNLPSLLHRSDVAQIYSVGILPNCAPTT